MSAVAHDAFDPGSVSLAWREHAADPPVMATCFFERAPVEHVIQKHLDGREPWHCILAADLANRLAEAARARRPPAAEDCRAFVKAVARQLAASCARPLLCRFQERDRPAAGTPDRPRRGFPDGAAWEKILFVLPSGAVAFARVLPSAVSDVTTLVLLTTFFPAHTAGWAVPARTPAAAARRYVERWAPNLHRSGGHLLPEHADWVPEEDEASGGAARRGRFRFVTAETWGFRPHEDGEWVWSGRTPVRF